MEGEVIIKYDNNNEIIEEIFKINGKEVYKEKFYENIHKLNKITITHVFYPLFHKKCGNCYGYEYIIEKDDDGDIIYISSGRFSNAWGMWGDIGLTGYKKDYEFITIKNSLGDAVNFFMKLPTHTEFLEFIVENTDEVFYEEDIKSEISKKYNIQTDDIDEVIIEKYLKEKYSNEKKDKNVKKIINLFDDEDNIYSIII